MATDSVKFLNEKCLLSAYITAWRELVEAENGFRVRGYMGHLHAKLGQILGAEIIKGKAEVTSRRDPGTGDYIRQAEVYALSPADMRKLYDMIRDEIRTERRARDDMAVPAVIEAIKALRDEPKRYWDADVDNFADELITRLQGES